MSQLTDLFDNLNDWPFAVFKNLSTLMKVVVILIALSAFFPAEPLDVVSLVFWAGIMAYFANVFSSIWILGLIGAVLWITGQIIEALLLFVLATYIAPAIVVAVATIFGLDANDAMFN